MKTVHEEADEFVNEIKSRARWVKLLKVPEFLQRVRNPRKALKGDLIKINFKNSRGIHSRTAVLVADATDFSDEETDRFGTEYSIAPVPYYYLNNQVCYGCQDSQQSGSGSVVWLNDDKRRPFGVQSVEVVGTLRFADIAKMHGK